MIKTNLLTIITAALILSACRNKDVNVNYQNNPASLVQNAYIKLPLGTVKPAGWLKSQLETQAAGLSGNIEDFWPDLQNSSMKGENRFSGDEHLSGKITDRAMELCPVVEYMIKLEDLYAIRGDNRLADSLEMLTFNEFPIISGLMLNYENCHTNMQQVWPKFVESMWMATNDNGLALVSYGPSVVKALVGKGKEVTISEETDYPFKGSVKLIINSAKTIRFPIEIRIPGWADSLNVYYKGKKVKVKSGINYRINTRWKNGDQIDIEIPLELRVENRYNNSLSVIRGPLYYSLRIEKEYKSVKINYDSSGYKVSIDWDILPKSAWNYGLLIDKNNIMRGIKVAENPVGKYPFADKGDMIWSADSGKVVVSTEEAPVVITARGIQIPEWTIKNNSADIPPLSPVKPVGDPEVIKLIPYGCARLRITEFPVMDIIMMEDVMRPGGPPTPLKGG